jgi:hypothetical protein
LKRHCNSRQKANTTLTRKGLFLNTPATRDRQYTSLMLICHIYFFGLPVAKTSSGLGCADITLLLLTGAPISSIPPPRLPSSTAMAAYQHSFLLSSDNVAASEYRSLPLASPRMSLHPPSPSLPCASCADAPLCCPSTLPLWNLFWKGRLAVPRCTPCKGCCFVVFR